MVDLLLTHARLPNGTQADVAIKGSHIAVPNGPAAETLDLDGALLLPGLIDGHVHLDKTLLGAGWIPHQGHGSVKSRIAGEKAIQDRISMPVRARAEALLAQALANGTTTLRTHVDIDPDIGLSRLTPILKLREAWADRVTIQIVAFPQSGMVAGSLELLSAALDEGADLIGGVDPIGIDGDLNGVLDALFGLAVCKDAGIDLHLHDRGEDGAQTIAGMAARTRTNGLQGRVVVGHGFCTADLEDAARGALIDAMADAGLALMTHGGANRPIVPVRALRDGGVTVFAGSDNVRDSWSPYGNADMLERVMLIGWRSDFRRDEDLRLAFDLCTGAAARALGLPPPGLEPGAPADLIAVQASGVPEAVAARPPRTLVIKAGRILRSSL